MPKSEVLRHVPAPGFRTCLIDGAATRLITDLWSDRISVSFTRMDSISTGEHVTILDDRRIQTHPELSSESENFKTIEFTIDLRPDAAVAVLNSILIALKGMSPQRRAAAGIPENLPNPIQMVAPEQRL